ncbi:MAG: type II secretion system F family protein [Acidimicrobiia bacterium]|nr:type II secretion system F family protein [Acidimicrobiia bacterium]MDH3469880.1 type II secretion system F family protein [Acidimicrobiia bacterium]
MRGTAALIAALAVWIMVGGTVHQPISLARPAMSKGEAGKALLAAGVSFLVILAITGVAIASFAVAVLAVFTTMSATSLQRRRRSQRMAEKWPDFLAILRTRLASGVPLQEAFITTGRHLGDEFDSVVDSIEERLSTGMRFDEAVSAVRGLLADPLSDRVLATVATAQVTGGGRVAEILAGLGNTLADELRLRRSIEAMLTQQRLTALIALLAPWLLLVLTVSTNPQAAAAYRTNRGTTVIMIGLVATSIGYLGARRTATLAKPPRVFT